MRKASRRHGWMWLMTYAPGDGAISFVWTVNVDRNKSVNEPVTESDISEFLRIPENEERWKGWDILDMGKDFKYRLAKNVERPFHSSRKLVMDGKTYRYAFDERMMSSGNWFQHDGRTTVFFEGARGTKVVKNTEIILALCFFLNNEEAFCRRKAQSD